MPAATSSTVARGSLADYSRLAELLEAHAEALADGNLALAAGRRGALVTATDLTPRMVELGRARTAAFDNIAWAEADAEQLPFADSSYDVVASVFGAMFAPQPRLVAMESSSYDRLKDGMRWMFRVAKPDGLVAMANYSPGVLNAL